MTDQLADLEAKAKAAPNFDLPDNIRIPLHELQADTRTSLARVAAEADYEIAMMYSDSIINKLSQIETACYQLIASHRALEARVREFDLAMQSLTPGGSEYVNNPQRCVDFVKQLKTDFHEARVKAAREIKSLEARVKGLEEALDEIIADRSLVMNDGTRQPSSLKIILIARRARAAAAMENKNG